MLLNYKIAGFITICVIAPFFEEILFRGILLRGILQNKINPAVAIGLSAFLFGLAHLNPWQFMGAGILGIAFGFVYYRTKSLWLCIFLHALNNTVSFLMMIKYDTMEENLTNPNIWYLPFLGLFVSILIGWGIYKLTEKTIRWS
jgi:membrane protease YdiL (CAAX protease family)